MIETKAAKKAAAVEVDVFFDLKTDSLLGPKEKALRKLSIQMQRNTRPMIGMGVLKYLSSNEFKITKSSLLPAAESAETTKYYSKVAEVNEQGELSGDETTQSGTSNTSDEDDVAVERIAKTEAEAYADEEEAEQRCQETMDSMNEC